MRFVSILAAIGLLVACTSTPATRGSVLAIAIPTETIKISPSPSATLEPAPIPTQVPTHTSSPTMQPTLVATPEPRTLSSYPPEVDRCVGGAKRVALTFDAGAGTQSIASILRALDRYHVKGSFFVTGIWAQQNPSWTQQIASRGHEIWNHTIDHAYRPPKGDKPATEGLTYLPDNEIRWELREAEAVISALTGVTTKPYFRPPYGNRDQRVWSVAWQEGYQSIYWTIDALDWMEGSGATEASVYRRVMNNLSPGTIYLFHIGDNLTGRLLDGLISSIRQQGYDFVSIQDCLK